MCSIFLLLIFIVLLYSTVLFSPHWQLRNTTSLLFLLNLFVLALALNCTPARDSSSDGVSLKAMLSDQK